MAYTQELDTYKKFCKTAIRELMVCEPRETVRWYQNLVNNATTDREVSRIMVRVREVI